MCARCAALLAALVGLRVPEIVLQECNVLQAAREISVETAATASANTWLDGSHQSHSTRYTHSACSEGISQYNHRLSSALTRLPDRCTVPGRRYGLERRGGRSRGTGDRRGMAATSKP